METLLNRLASAQAKLTLAQIRLESVCKVAQENLTIAHENLLAAAMELRQPYPESDSLDNKQCVWCGNFLASSYDTTCSSDCAEKQEYSLKEAEATGN